jgi:hypothetical protein
MSKILAIDPGTTDGAVVVWDAVESKVAHCEILPNDKLIEFIKQQQFTDEVHCEMIASYGMAVGKETFETCVWIGRCEQVCRDNGWAFNRIYRKDVKMWHCNSMKAKDTNIRRAVMDKYGETGTKKNPGPLYGIASHMWSALAIATFVAESKPEQAAVETVLKMSTIPSGS